MEHQRHNRRGGRDLNQVADDLSGERRMISADRARFEEVQKSAEDHKRRTEMEMREMRSDIRRLNNWVKAVGGGIGALWLAVKLLHPFAHH